MGKIVEPEKKRKKKGRPSLLDIQKRNLKLQQQQQEEELRQRQEQQLKQLKRKSQNPKNTTPLRRSVRRNPNLDPDNSSEDEGEENDDQSGGKGREKKLRLVHNLPKSSANSAPCNSGSDLKGEDDEAPSTSQKRRKIETIGDGSGEKGTWRNQANSRPAVDLDDGPSTPLPDKKLLLFVLDRLQKKDTYGVFSEPVDPEELPDYHEVIENPIDFSTIKKNITSGVYKSLEHFERDVFLLCSNAMQYNAPDTIYFRQARAIQELAQKNFDNLRQDSDDDNEPQSKAVRPPTKNVKKLAGRPSLDSEHPQTTPPTVGENTYRDLRKVNSYDKYLSPDLSGRISYGSRHGEVYINWSAEKHVENFGGSTSKGVSMRHGKKQVILDESSKRSTYMMIPDPASNSSSVLTTFDGERKQLVPVGIHSQYGYARSLALFAVKLGPVAWKVVSKKIGRCLPPGVKYGPGWVGENDLGIKLPTPSPSFCTTTTTTTRTTTTTTCQPECGSDNLPPDNSLVVSGPSSIIQPDKPQLDNRSSTAVPDPAIDSTTTLPVVTSPPTSGEHHHADSTRCVQLQAHKSSLHQQPRVNGANGFNVPAYNMGKLIGPSGFNSHSNLTVSAASSGTRSRFDAGTNDSAGAATVLGQNPITTTSNSSPHSVRPSGSGSESSDHDVIDPATLPDLNEGFSSPGGQLCAK